MSELSNDAQDLLLTIRKRASKTQAGKITSNDRICAWYDIDEDNFDAELKPLIAELLAGRCISMFNEEDDQYKLLPKGENYAQYSPATVVNTFSNISNSQIASMSNAAKQKLNIQSLDEATKRQLNELIEALSAKDESRAKRIVDGLLVSTPGLILQALQIGLGVGNE